MIINNVELTLSPTLSGGFCPEFNKKHTPLSVYDESGVLFIISMRSK